MKSNHGGARPGAGRKPGKVSQAKKDIAEAAREHAPAALDALVEILGNQKEPASSRVSAASHILDRAYGRPSQDVDLNASVEASDALTDLLVKIAEAGKKVTDGG